MAMSWDPELLAPLATLAEWATAHPEVWQQYIGWVDSVWNAHRPEPFTEQDHEEMLRDTRTSKQWADSKLREFYRAID